MHALIIFLFLATTHAQTYLVKDGMRKYELSFTKDAVKLTSTGIDLSVQKNACNESLIKNFIETTKMAYNKATRLSSPQEHSIQISSGKENFYLLERSQEQEYFQSIPTEIKRLKIEEQLKCSKPTSSR